MFHTNDFRTGLTQSIGDTAIAATLTAARWGELAWDWYTATFFSAAAARRYEWIGQMLACLAMACYLAGKASRELVAQTELQHWVDAQVSASLPANDHIVGVNKMVESDPFCPTVNPLPVVVAPVPAMDDEAKKLEVSMLESLTIRQLKAAAKGKVPGYGRMTKAQLIQALN